MKLELHGKPEFLFFFSKTSSADFAVMNYFFKRNIGIMIVPNRKFGSLYD